MDHPRPAPAATTGSSPVAAPLLPDGWGSTTDNTVLLDLIRAEIRQQGRITFRRFMELVLYHPAEGYYRTRPAIGARGDYLTSPEVHPLFGAVMLRQLAEFWELLDRPAAFRLVEIGAGNGGFARNVLAAAPSEFRDALRYVIVEPGVLQQHRQAATLGSLANRVEWVPEP